MLVTISTLRVFPWVWPWITSYKIPLWIHALRLCPFYTTTDNGNFALQA